MMSGFDRYFQIAPSFRDEDARADRSPGEFYQIDIEMSYVTQEDVFQVVEKLMIGLFQEFSKWPISEIPFPRIKFRDAIRTYGTDKPDLRIPLKIVDATAIFAETQTVFTQFKYVKAVLVPKGVTQARSFFDGLTEFYSKQAGSPLSWILVRDGQLRGNAAKVVTLSQFEQILAELGGNKDDAVVFSANNDETLLCKTLGLLRVELGRILDLTEKNVFRFCWIVDFPMFEMNDGKLDFSHNPFSMPKGGMEALLSQDPLEISANQYDIVCNGYELSSGAIRNHAPDIMYKAFEMVGYSRDVVDRKFPALINAFRFGAPPHGGIAPGLDRIMMLLADEPNLREVIAFPMNQRAQDLLMNAPSEVTPQQLKELHIRVVADE